MVAFGGISRRRFQVKIGPVLIVSSFLAIPPFQPFPVHYLDLRNWVVWGVASQMDISFREHTFFGWKLIVVACSISVRVSTRTIREFNRDLIGCSRVYLVYLTDITRGFPVLTRDTRHYMPGVFPPPIKPCHLLTSIRTRTGQEADMPRGSWRCVVGL
jgi:hypothetical protein